MNKLLISERQRNRYRAGWPGKRRNAGASNLRTALLLGSLALLFFVGVIVNRYLFAS